MEIIKYVSVQEIFAKVLSDLDINNEALRVSDWIVWTGEALKKINAFPMWKNRITGIDDGMFPSPIIQISNYRAELPCDLYQIIQMAVGSSSTGSWYPIRQATGSFETRQGKLTSLSSNTDNTYPPGTDDKTQFISDIFNEGYADAFSRINSTPSLSTILNAVFLNENTVPTNINNSYDNEIVFTINGPYVDLSIETGYLLISYKAMPTDSDGYPLIPDNEIVKEAVYWYINMKQSYPVWRNGQMRDGIYQHAEHQWGTFRKNAYGTIMMPSDISWKAIGNIWMRLIPNLNQDTTFFNHIGSQQRIYNH